MGKQPRGQLTERQRERLVEAVHRETAALEAQNHARIDELRGEGLGVSPISLLAAQVEALVHWVAPTEYARARFDRDVQVALSVALDEGNVGKAREQMDEAHAKAAAERAAMEAAAKGRTESGLYVPDEAASKMEVTPGDLKIVPLSPPPQ